MVMRLLSLAVSFFLFFNTSLIVKISYRGSYTGTTSDGWDMFFNIDALDRAGLFRYNINTGEAFIGQAILQADGSFDFINLSGRYTGTVTEGNFQGQIIQPGKSTITFSGLRKSDFGPYAEMRGSYTGWVNSVSEPVRTIGLLIAADGDLIVFYTTDLNSFTMGKGRMLSDTTFNYTESTGIIRTGTFTLLDNMQMSGLLEGPQDTLGFIATNSRKANHMVNISTRGFVGSGDNVMIAGFIIVPNAKTVLIRGIGPSLSDDGVPDTLLDPILILKEGQTTLATNDNWQSNANFNDINLTGIPPADTREAALFIRLEPGTYTVILADADGATGNGLIEVYEVD
jgi:hypothetical protein